MTTVLILILWFELLILKRSIDFKKLSKLKLFVLRWRIKIVSYLLTNNYYREWDMALRSNLTSVESVLDEITATVKRVDEKVDGFSKLISDLEDKIASLDIEDFSEMIQNAANGGEDVEKNSVIDEPDSVVTQ